MRNYIYFATEESCFECWKSNSDNLASDIKEYLLENWYPEDEANKVVLEMMNKYHKDGFAIFYGMNQEYDIILGVAKYGKCANVSGVINEERRNLIRENF